nr:hypothetical protein [Tanacetum cinerariifolium]
MKSNFEATIVSYLSECKPTLRLVAFDAAIGYLHLTRNIKEKMFCVTVADGGRYSVGANEEESEAYDIGRDGLVRVARVYDEVEMLAQAEMGYSFRIWVSRFLRATPSSDGRHMMPSLKDVQQIK